MTAVEVVPVEPWHAEFVGAWARAADELELWSSNRVTPAQAARICVALSPDAKTALFDGIPACVFGVNPGGMLGDGSGTPWMIGTPLVEQHSVAFLRRCRPVVRAWAKRYTSLRNHVDARNGHAVAWLRWLGFSVAEPVPYGPDGLPFHPFSMEAQNV